jgi:hypothetical protein
MLNISKLLRLGHAAWLAQEGREDKRLLDCRGTLMNIHLLAVASHSLKADSLRSAIDQDGSVDFAKVFSLSKNIEQTGARSARLEVIGG